MLHGAWWALPGAVLGAVLGGWMVVALGRIVGGQKRHRVAVRRAARAKRGEDVGEDLLVAEGYEIVLRQATLTACWQVDDVREEYTLRADWLVERDGLRWVADAKTGDWARSVSTRATRRQMLEYIVQYDVEGALLVDAEAGQIHQLRFEGLRQGASADALSPTPSGLWGVEVLLVVAVAWAIWRIASAFAA